MSDEKPTVNPLRPWAFAWLYDKLVPVAREKGYVLALHGSMARDLDLIAVPWTEDAVSAGDLILAIQEVTGTFRLGTSDDDYVGVPEEDEQVAVRPHGRLAWALHFYGSPYIDISVMPRMVNQ